MLKTMINELILLFHTLIIGSSALLALRLGNHALISFICICSVLANVFVIKQTTLFGLTATCSDAYFVGAMFGLNILQEYYGKKIAQLAIWVSLFLLIFYALMSIIHLNYIPGINDTAQIHYQAIFGSMPRIALASLTSYFIVQQIDYALYGFLKKVLAGHYLLLRSYASLLVCQLIDTVLFSFLGLYGIIDDIGSIIIISYTIKVAVIFLNTPFMALSKFVYKKHD